MRAQRRHVRRSKKGKLFRAGRRIRFNRHKRKRYGAFGRSEISDIIQYLPGDKAQIKRNLYIPGVEMPYARAGAELSRERAKDISKRLYLKKLTMEEPKSNMAKATEDLEKAIRKYR